MLLALASSVAGKVRPIQEKGSRGRKSDSLLRSALRAFGVKESTQDDVLACDTGKFLREWGVEVPCSALLDRHVAYSELVLEQQTLSCKSSVTKVSVDGSGQRLKCVAISELKLFCTMKGTACLQCKVLMNPLWVTWVRERSESGILGPYDGLLSVGHQSPIHASPT